MSYSSSGGGRGLPARAPEKGVFPLDHFGECKAAMKLYMQCLQQHNAQAEKCKDVSRAYLECRMSKSLMAEEDLDKLGLKLEPGKAQAPTAGPVNEARKREGYIAGLHGRK